MGTYEEVVTEWIHAVINIDASDPFQTLIKAYDFSSSSTEIGLDDIRLVNYKCGR